jgi:ppGpp synthetase/RelA/SpoT-type nucleotidyltranferase
MIAPAETQRTYAHFLPHIEYVAKQVGESLRRFCAKNSFIFDERIKTLESLAEKIETGRFQSWSQLDDLYACTIAVPLPSNEAAVLEFLNDAFVQCDLKKRLAAKKAPDVFRFDSTRFVGTLKSPPDSGGSTIASTIRFEIQVKTLFEMAWSRTTHALAYKSSSVDWKTLRLAASLKASVEQMDLLLTGFESMTEAMEEAPWPDVERKRKLQLYFESKFQGENFPSEVAPKDYSRFLGNCSDLLFILERSEAQRARVNVQEVNLLDSALSHLDRYFSNVDLVSFPRSISMFQVVLGVWLVNFHFPSRERRWFPISSEMETIFPELKNIQQRFTHPVAL